MQRNAIIPIPATIAGGASLGLSPRSTLKNMKKGNLMPACRNTPAEATSSANQAQIKFWLSAEAVMSVLLIKPLVRGTPEIARAPIVPSTIVIGIVL